MKKKNTFLINFAGSILKALKIRHVRLYGHKFSKKIYTLHQHIVLLALREYHKGMGYRRFCKLLPDYSLLLEYLKLSQIPHFTTLQKVSKRLSGTLIESIFLGFARKAKFRAGIDSTGLSLQHSTYYYEKRLEHFRKAKKKKPGRPKNRRKKKHQYTSIFADLDKQIILSTKLLRGSKSDNKMMRLTIRKAKELFDQIISNDADKGYDAEYNHAFIVSEMNAEDYIKLKNKDVSVRRTKGENRKKAKQNLRKKKGRPRKNHRNKMETIMFVLKKVFGEHLTATTAKGQRQQARFRMIAYNAYKKSMLILFKDFYAAAYFKQTAKERFLKPKIIPKNMQGTIVNYRRGRHTQKDNQMVVLVDEIADKKEAETLIGKKVVFTTQTGKEIIGKVSGTHGTKKAIKVLFEKGMPGQSLSKKVIIE